MQEILNFKIDNFNTKLQSECFLHLWKTLGQYSGEDLIHKYQYTINGNADVKWHIHDIGKVEINQMPPWMILMSHNLNLKELKRYWQMEKGEVYFVIFKQIKDNAQ